MFTFKLERISIIDQFQRRLIIGLSELIRAVKELKGANSGRNIGIDKLAYKIGGLTNKIDDLSDNIRRIRD